MKNVALLLLVSVISVFFSDIARAQDNIVATQEFCIDGRFKVTVEMAGQGATLPAPQSPCVILAQTKMSYRGKIARHVRMSNAWHGNLIDYAAQTVLGQKQVSYRQLKMPNPKTYRAREANCGPFSFIIVDETATGPSLRANSQAAITGECNLDDEGGIRISSNVDLTGVYDLPDNLKSFVRNLK